MLLLLLLHPLYLCPHQISRFSQHRDHLALLRLVKFRPILHLSDTLKCARQALRRAQLLLLLLLLLLAASLLLTAFRHTISYLTWLSGFAQRLRHRRAVPFPSSYTRRARKLDMIPCRSET